LENQNDNSILSEINKIQDIDLNYHEVSKFVNNPNNNELKCVQSIN